jgi:rubrerythrin
MSIFRHPENTSESKNEKTLEKSEEGKNIVCFACGTELPPNTKKCPNCGISLK